MNKAFVRIGVLFAALSLPTLAHARCEDLPTGFDAPRKPQNAGRDIVGQDLDEILDRGFIEFGVYEDFAPFSFEEDGELRGIDIDLGREIAKIMGIEARFNALAAGETVETDFRNYIWKGNQLGAPIVNVMLHAPYDQEFGCRIEQVVMTGQYFEETIAIAYDPVFYEDEIPTPAYYRYDKVAVENDTIADFYLSGSFGGQLLPNIVRFDTAVEAAQAVGTDDIHSAAGPRSQLEFAAPEGIIVATPPMPGLARGTWTLGVVVSQSYRALGYFVDDAIGEIVSTGRMEEIFASYGLSYTAPER